LQEILKHSLQLQELTRLVRTILPDYLGAYCTVAAWENEKITLHVNNASAGTFLRYQLPKILLLLQSHARFRSIDEIILHIRPAIIQNNNKETKKIKRKSRYAAEILQEAVANVTKPEVQAALQRLAKTLGK